MGELIFDNWITAVTTISGIIGGIWVWISEKKRRSAEKDGEVNNAVEGMVRIYRNMVDDVNEKMIKLSERVKSLEEERESNTVKIFELEEKVFSYEKKVEQLESDIEEYKKQILLYKNQVTKLKTELKKYKEKQ